jgi:hypothetical protein
MLEAELASKEELKVELQRHKDELRDTREELAIANNKLQQLRTNKENRVPNGHPQRPPPLTNSKSLRKIHGMLDQMRSLENRVATFKSSLPRSTTPTAYQGPATSTPTNHRTNTPTHLTRSRTPTSTPTLSTPNMSGTPNRSITPRSVTPINKAGTPTNRHRSITPTASPHNIRGSENSSVGTSLPIWSTRVNSPSGSLLDRTTSPLQDDKAAVERRHRRRELSLSGFSTVPEEPQTGLSSHRLGTIPGSPSGSSNYARTHHSVRLTSSRNQMVRSPSPRKSTTNLQEPAASARPGSVFSSLHSRQSLGHGRLV